MTADELPTIYCDAVFELCLDDGHTRVFWLARSVPAELRAVLRLGGCRALVQVDKHAPRERWICADRRQHRARLERHLGPFDLAVQSVSDGD